MGKNNIKKSSAERLSQEKIAGQPIPAFIIGFGVISALVSLFIISRPDKQNK